MVRNTEVKPEQSDDRADKPLGLPQRQAKDRTQHQRRGNRQRRVMRLAAWRSSRLPSPPLAPLVCKPYGQAASPLQCLVILGPVRDPISGLGNVVTVFSVVFER